jgi:hypothetical protein
MLLGESFFLFLFFFCSFHNPQIKKEELWINQQNKLAGLLLFMVLFSITTDFLSCNCLSAELFPRRSCLERFVCYNQEKKSLEPFLVFLKGHIFLAFFFFLFTMVCVFNFGQGRVLGLDRCSFLFSLTLLFLFKYYVFYFLLFLATFFNLFITYFVLSDLFIFYF